MWNVEHTIETAASRERLWALLADVNGWATWNDGVEAIQLEGPFAEGSSFVMKPTGQDPMVTNITRIEAPRLYVDETPFGGLVVRVEHRLDALPSGTRITFRLEVDGAGADEVGPQIGPGISADFPDVMAKLARLALA
jgi:Polyketide cyclase / dehydrase and lipid transport